MTNAVITIQAATSNGMIERYSSSSSFWTIVADVCAAFVVIGIVAEILELSPKILKAGLEKKWRCFVSRKAKIESWLGWFELRKHGLELWGGIFWVIIVVALAGELLGSMFAQHFDSLIIGKLTTQSSDAWTNAAGAIEFAAKIGTTNAMLVASNQVNEARIEELRSNNIVLEAQLNPRIIEISRPAKRLKQYGGIQVAIVFGQCSDCSRLASQIAAILHEAGWDIIGSFSTLQPVPDGVSIGVCSTNENWGEDFGPMSEGLFNPIVSRHPPGFSVEVFEKLTGASDALTGEINNAGFDAKRNGMINGESTLRFQGILVLIGPRPSPWQKSADNAMAEYLNSATNFNPNGSLSLIERRKALIEAWKKMSDANMRALGTTNFGGRWIIPGGKYP